MKRIYIGYYDLTTHRITHKVPFEIYRETEKLYMIKPNHQFCKDEEGKVQHLSATTYPYLRVYFVDVDNPKVLIHKAFAKWFMDKAELILEGRLC